MGKIGSSSQNRIKGRNAKECVEAPGLLRAQDGMGGQKMTNQLE